MPGCQKNILSQIVDIDGIWEGKTIMCMKRFSQGKISVSLFTKLAKYFGTGLIFSKQRTFNPKYRLFTGESRQEETVERKYICSQIPDSEFPNSGNALVSCPSIYMNEFLPFSNDEFLRSEVIFPFHLVMALLLKS